MKRGSSTRAAPSVSSRGGPTWVSCVAARAPTPPGAMSVTQPGGLSHVGVRVPAALLANRKLALEGRHVEYVAEARVTLGGRKPGAQPADHDEGRDGVGGHRMHQLAGSHVAKTARPRSHLAEV
eukprot:scaffold57223_cov48-Phaeocystis_antarctica.AAC.3